MTNRHTFNPKLDGPQTFDSHVDVKHEFSPIVTLSRVFSIAIGNFVTGATRKVRFVQNSIIKVNSINTKTGALANIIISPVLMTINDALIGLSRRFPVKIIVDVNMVATARARRRVLSVPFSSSIIVEVLGKMKQRILNGGSIVIANSISATPVMLKYYLVSDWDSSLLSDLDSKTLSEMDYQIV